MKIYNILVFEIVIRELIDLFKRYIREKKLLEEGV